MNIFLEHISNLIILACSFAVALLLFQRGLLLKRVELQDRSSCTDVAYSMDSCWLPSQYKRVVLLLIDALRYDFINASSNLNALHVGNMRNAHQLLQNSENSILLHFIADPPTTTMQRLKALTTGSLPTFIDISNNFASTTIMEDNWIDQLVRSGRDAVFMGDDTWISLFPNQFLRKYHLPSFDVNDIHTVDDMILGNIYHELSQTDWTVLIAHFLGVDHCGHKYGPNSLEMASKLSQMDEVIKNVTQLIDDDVLLIVMGDHGMTDTGDHGGDDQIEVDAALLLYSNKKLLYSSVTENSIAQIDIVPTISLLLDLPIPFSNIGTAFENIFPQEVAASVVQSNAWQIIRYAQRMAIAIPELEWHLRHFELSQDNLQNYLNTMNRLKTVFRHHWTNFNSNFILIGILSFLESILSCFDSMFNMGNISKSWLVFRSGLLFIQASTFIVDDEENYISAVLILICSSIVYRISRLLNSLFTLSYSTSTILISSFPVIYALSNFSNSFIVYESTIIRFVTQTVFVYATFYASHQNLIVQKSHRCRHFTSFVTWFSHRFNFRRITLVLTAVFMLRIGKVFERCREEQQDFCQQTMFALPIAKIPRGTFGFVRFTAALLCLVLFCCYTRYRLRKYSSEFIHSSLTFPACIAIAFHWILEWLPEKVLRHFSNFWNICIQFVYAISAVCLISIVIRATRKESRKFLEGISNSYFVCVLSILIVLLGDGIFPSLIINVALFFISLDLIKDDYQLVVFLTMLSSHSYFAFAHQTTFASIPWNAAFMGLSYNANFRWLSATLVIMNMFASQIILSCSLPVLALQRLNMRGAVFDSPILFRHIYVSMLFNSLKVFSIVCASALLKRHLMMWKIFVPKLVFESISFGVFIVSATLNCVIFRRISS